jgi:uncharacterized membrane protein
VNPLFIAIYIATAFVYLFAHSCGNIGLRRTILLFALTYSISLLFESTGVKTGMVYGTYQYSDRLGPMFLGLVPYAIPLTWFIMIYPSLVIATRIVPVQKNRTVWVLMLAGTGALAMTAWDLVLDPVMIHFEFWEWEINGLYFGVPLQNYLGWLVTSFSIFSAFLILGRIPGLDKEGRSADPNRLAVIAYVITGLTTALVAVNFGLFGPAIVGSAAMLPIIVLGLRGKYLLIDHR